MRLHIRLLAAVAFMLLLLVTIELSGLRGHFSLEFVQGTFRKHSVGGVFLFVLLFCIGNLAHIPGLVFLLAAVLTLGQLWGGLMTYLAACISCLVTFLVIRLVGGDALVRIKSRFARKILDQLHARPVSSIFVLRVVFQTLPALNAALALSGVGLKPYLVGTAAGLPFPIAVYCIFFNYLAHLR